MKKLLSILTIATLIASCGGDKNAPSVESIIEKGNLEELKTKKDELKNEITTLNAQITEINTFLKKNDTLNKGTLVTALTIKDTLFNHFIEVQGNIETKQNLVIYPEFQGTLSKVFVKEGQRVTKGQTLARIDDGGLSSQLSQLESQAALSKTTYERQKRLWDQKIGSEIQYLQAKTQFESSENMVAQMKSQLAKTAVRAPFSGIIDEVITDQGSVVAPGQPIFRIVNLSDMFVTSEIPESYLTSVVPGKKVLVTLPVIGKTITSQIRQTGNYINPSNRSFTVEVDVPNKDGLVKPNLTARLSINDYTAENAILIPLSVINENSDGDQYVYIAFAKADSAREKIVAKRQIIKTGKTQGDFIEVIEGLKNGDQVIVEGARSVKNDQEIKIKTY
ncbi:efflux RND transporter periplasmic adaptor subunit [uncultured Dokdonia sp.]|uniref:efflux RND transporter periplasmic adaptor subunit n=1 Tax=uncultured Dokdonia sp. TaxID=575653 RepID=UPI0026139563|nr:efflux RND transporter periplasmic adaptor subunit [uncultured Dokdonia sp.]